MGVGPGIGGRLFGADGFDDAVAVWSGNVLGSDLAVYAAETAGEYCVAASIATYRDGRAVDEGDVEAG